MSSPAGTTQKPDKKTSKTVEFIFSTGLTICDDDCELQPVLNEDAGLYSDTIQEIYDNALDQEALLCQAIGFLENLLFNDVADKTIVLKGGCDQSFSGNTLSVTHINGSITFNRGAIVFSEGCFSVKQD